MNRTKFGKQEKEHDENTKTIKKYNFVISNFYWTLMMCVQ